MKFVFNGEQKWPKSSFHFLTADLIKPFHFVNLYIQIMMIVKYFIYESYNTTKIHIISTNTFLNIYFLPYIDHKRKLDFFLC